MRPRNNGVDDPIALAVHRPPQVLLQLALLNDELRLELLHVLSHSCLHILLKLPLQLPELVDDRASVARLAFWRGDACTRTGRATLEDFAEQALIAHDYVGSAVVVDELSEIAFLGRHAGVEITEDAVHSNRETVTVSPELPPDRRHEMHFSSIVTSL